ncbi:MULTISPECIES: iron uptake porin [unclassified Coleofasciculus]|uniref:iron uptake porin n=1 Tax=unclassified Coleofasciculus TaxID=2692782 RepID=UPI00188209BF|nr:MULTISPECIES: iron uptake porin [unclassified Coleofasciculus]MBE9128828.1 iron uptake porin [Coleofasciculus sp. LEGE 07081]MBE9151534.1 iron uptake porin [Coleofasciculus sp. LEGE 07092]
MSTMFWKALKVSPALLGASLLVASSGYAAQTVPNSIAGSASTESAVELKEESSETSVAEGTLAEPTSLEFSPSVNLANSTLGEATLAADAPQTSVNGLLEGSKLTPVEASPNLNLAQSIPAEPAPANSGGEVLEQIQNYSGQDLGEGSADALDQVTNVSQLRDVSPGDWAYEALRSLVERYGCIAGYPDGTFRGNRAMTRYEFAAGLNACLQQIERLIVPNGPDGPEPETLRRLVQEFEAELATLGARVDNLEGRVGFLEDHQFSTTTKLRGEVIFALADAWGDSKAVASGLPQSNDDIDANTILADRVRLNLETSFTGRDRLRTRLEAANISSFRGDLTGTNMTRLGFDGGSGNDVAIDELWYRFPLGDNILVQIDAANGEFQDTILAGEVVNPFFDSSGSGAISRFGRFNPIYRIGGGAGGTVTFNFNEALGVSVGYFADEGNDPGDDRGLFNGNYSALAQLAFTPTENITLAATYGRSYYRGGNVNVTGSTGSGFASDPFTDDVATGVNSYGVEANVQFGRFSVGGWVGYQDAEAKATAIEGSDAEIWNWAVNLALLDLGGEGNRLGVVFGMPPKATDNDVAGREDDDTSYHLEGFYRYSIGDNIAITPGVIVIFNPEHNDDNDTIYVGTLRTVFSF